MNRRIFVTMVVALFAAVVARAIYVEYPGAMAVGVVRRTAAIGGEGTGWTLKMAQPLQLASNSVKSIDLEPGPNAPKWLDGRRVRVEGTIVWRSGIERGSYPVLVASGIYPVPYFRPVPIPMSR
jgi:hypothetical protein